MRYHVNQNEHLKKSITINSAESVERKKPSHHGWECKWVHSLGRTLWRFFKKLNTEIPSDPAIPYLGTDPEKTKSVKDTCIPTITAALCTITKTGKQLKCTRTDEWIQKM